jgi:general secretion pathway protein A
MYLDFHRFREKPFNLTPDPRFLFLSKNHREAFAHLLYGIDHRAGFISLTGEVGSGKTTVLRALLSQLDADHYRTALIFNPRLSAPELLQNINREFGIPNTSDSSSPLEALNLFLLQQNAGGRTVVLVIDEVQNLEAPVLEQIRLISNLETDREKLIQIVLSGQPEFLQILERKEMRQLSQRITVRYHLQPMDFQDTVSYVRHRMIAAGGTGGDIFSRRALKRIYQYSRGLPRLINAACDRALLAGYTKDSTKISSRIAEIAIRDIKRNTASYAWKRHPVLLPALVVLAFFFAALYVYRHDLLDRFSASPRIEAKEKQTKEELATTGEKLSRTMAAELGGVPESESTRRAFNALASRWNVPAVSDSGELKQPNGLELAARNRSLRLHRFSGNLGALLRIDYPAALELALPGISGKRFVSLVGTKDGRLLVDPPIAGRSSLSTGEIEKHWSGQGFLLWKDPLNLLPKKSPGPRGSHIKRLQGLLQEAGNFSKPLTGVYDGDTLSAIKDFQLSRGIEQDGIVGDQTLMLLYRSVGRFEVPRLTGG